MLHVFSDILQSVDRGDISVLVLLDLSAAFDTVDYEILLQRLRVSFGIDDVVHRWFQSYLLGRKQCVRRGNAASSVTHLQCGVPQGSVLGPVLFILYTADLISLVESHNLSSHLYADDTQLYGSCRPANVDELSQQISACTTDVASWMKSNRLQLNCDKTEVLWCATGRRQHQLPHTPLLVDSVPVAPVSSVRNLGIYLDSDLVMRSQVSRTVSRCFATLRQLRQIRCCIPPTTFQTLVVALVLSRLDYGNCVLYAMPAYLMQRLQSVMNAAARLIYGLRLCDHISEALISLHWLRVNERVQYKLAVSTYKVLNGTAPSYLGPFTRVADLPGRRSLRSATTHRLVVPAFKLVSVGGRAFPVTGPKIWNSLPEYVTAAPSLQIFRRQLKTFLIRQSHQAS